eukprot:scaffold57815_cov53-Cyclotella_meneghiniana.AAC.3
MKKCPGLDKTIPSGHPPITNKQSSSIDSQLPLWLQRSHRSLEGYPLDDAGNLLGSPSFENGAINLPGLLQVADTESGATLADVIADSSTAVSTDLCLVRFQQLPPPAGPDGSYSFTRSMTDLQSLQELADTMTQRFYDLSGPNVINGGILFAAATSGSGGAKAYCDNDMDTSRFCHESVLNNPLTWPEAVTGYKLTADTVDAVKDTIATWRSSEEGHLPSLTWVYNGGDPENGGSEYGIWGDPSVGLLVTY